jgi:hypothetical protein
VFGGGLGDDTGGQPDEGCPLPSAVSLAAGHCVSHEQVGAAGCRTEAISRLSHEF